MAAPARKMNWFAIGVTAVVVVVLVVVAVIVVQLNNSSAPDAGPTVTPQAPSVDAETGAIAVGSGEQTMDTYIDFMCPVCNQFEQLYGEAIQGLVADGTITLNIHPISILDRQSQGTQYSTRAANAMYCVALTQPELSVPFMQAMFANQPAEGTPGLTDAQILEVASGVGASGIDACVTEGEFATYVAAMTEKTPVAPGAAGVGTPTIAINGAVIANSTLPDPAQLGTLFE
ncbi:DsbA family protein [Microbacterium sp. zg.B48]|uniref:DsbA family protein n=1 Tax=unclassified Microbacterium TaxID=2609290 RepID=UPI00214B7CB9|nr:MULTISPECIES: DsbA family protein [unclassified Microbacterium]MCR2763259.1 DsbA family protein [Microbacterium sp. zg.B48]MCR2808848.1 DsbA family protein [Microbacterium sp. zg.B185]WIM18733.1 DsbA family protein [Microbacterium sp. zg-B185]